MFFRISQLLILLTLANSILFSQETDSSKITIERLYNSRDFAAERVGQINWLNSGNEYTSLEWSNGKQQIVKYNVELGDTTILVDGSNLISPIDSSNIIISGYSFSADMKLLQIFTNTKRVWRRNTRGDYWILNLENWKLQKLGGDADPSTLMFATLSPDNNSAAYVRENNLYVESLLDHSIIQLTYDGSETLINGTFDWVYEEELGLRNGFRWSPDGTQIAYWQLDASGVGVFNMINNTDSIYSKLIPVQYPKSGTQNSACKVGVVDIETQKTEWIEIPGDPRNNYIARMEWAESSSELIIQQLNRLQNNNSIYIADSKTGKANNIYTEVSEDAWLEVVDDVKWFDNGKYFTWISDQSGWNHIYLISRDGKEVKNITNGEFEVIEIASIDQENQYVYFTASPENATQKYLFRKSIFGNEPYEMVTPFDNQGFNTYSISPNFEWAVHRLSTINDPGIVEIVSLPDHKTKRILATNEKLRNTINDLNIKDAEFFSVTVDDSISLDGYKILPPNFTKDEKHPVLFYVYGEPAGQTVTDRWSRSYLWHQMLAQNGYIVISVDNRGTPAPKGRYFRKCVYGKKGIISSYDQAEAAKQIMSWDYIDENRVGIWGWSGGGSMTLNMLFRYPEIYKLGVAVAPVTDLKLYDTIYEERYMGLPSENAEAYKLGSPITFAHQLEGKLLLVHGTADDNVHFQNSELLVNELIKHNKKFTFLPYPNRSHGIYEGKGTTRHLYENITDFIMTNL